MITHELNEIQMLAEQYRTDRNTAKVDECIDAIRLLVELIQDIRILIDVKHEKEKNNTKGQNQ